MKPSKTFRNSSAYRGFCAQSVKTRRIIVGGTNSSKSVVQAELTPSEGVKNYEADGVKRRQLLTVVAPACASLCLPLAPFAYAAETAETVEALRPPIVPPGALSAAEQATVDLFERNSRGVVNIIDVTIRAYATGGAQVEVPEGNGTGFVWDSRGNIVTNYHVLANVLRNDVPNRKSVAKVTLLGEDGYSQVFDATLVGFYKAKDLAVVRINAPAALLRPLPLGNSSNVKVGQIGYAIGNPFGFDHTLTTGVVSGLDRQIQSQVGSVITGGIQTDAAINPGNSGGPLMDSKGKVVGVNTAIFTRSGFSSGIGFAIPIDTVKQIVPQIIAFGRVQLPSLNLQVADEKVAGSFQVKNGVLVQGIIPNSAAAKAGLLATRRGISGVVLGDIILSINDKKVRSAADLDDAVQRYGVGEIVNVHIQRRDGNKDVELDIPVQLEEERV
eukprot:CAMPEP_0114227992 /NCGR_PEP_ID=MMETSP0058-20121206/2096_1 /TAXON_ID=36894 /ORGANISM="Pyramimonas parkeae, CCMP726" /LENGTH=441 /DNA_ID=CAMNT_0001338891 /DNA_START=75 /DNA_END=1400 /DNA_ORIENTATION=+